MVLGDGGDDRVGGGYLELEVLILKLAVNCEETSNHKKKFEFVEIESVRVEREHLKRTKTPNTTEHFNQKGNRKTINKKIKNGSSWIGHHCSHYLRKMIKT